MRARRITVDPSEPDASRIAEAADLLRAGALVAFPTETVYGLGAIATDPAAVAQVFEAKGRPASDPLIVHVHPAWDLGEVLAEVSPVAERLVAAFWPGPLTIVGPRTASIPDGVTAGGSSVAVRAPAHPVALALLAAVGAPLAAPSANRFSYVSPTSADHVDADLGERCAAIVDGGRATWGIESTVVAERAGRLEVLRHGAVTAEELVAAVGDLVAVVDPATDDDDEGPSISPGRSVRHYAPTTATIAVRPAVLAHPLPGLGDGRITCVGVGARPSELPPTVRFVPLGDGDDLPAAAWALYDVLRRLDAEGETDLLLLVLTGRPGLGRAIDDRIRRAASGRVAETGDDLAQPTDLGI